MNDIKVIQKHISEYNEANDTVQHRFVCRSESHLIVYIRGEMHPIAEIRQNSGRFQIQSDSLGEINVGSISEVIGAMKVIFRMVDLNMEGQD